MLPALALRLRLRVLLALLAAAAVCLLATPAVRKFACKIGAMDMPGESRRVHDHPIPRLGGLALFAGFLAGVLPFTGIDEPVQGILLGSVIIVVTGAVDDLISLRPWVKLVLQLIAALVAIRHGVVIRILTNPGNASAEAIALGALSIPVTLLWIVGMTNALNLIDGLDGLAAGVCGIGCASMLAVSLFLPEATEISVLVAALGGACLGFLPFNINPAKIFMGDSGSLLLGYVLSTASVLGLFKMYTLVAFAVPVLTLALPLTDTAFAVIRRLSRGESPFHPDRGHIHHRLLALGLTQKQAVAVLYAASGILGAAAVLLAANAAIRFWLLLGAVTLAFGIWLYIFAGHRSPPIPRQRSRTERTKRTAARNREPSLQIKIVRAQRDEHFPIAALPVEQPQDRQHQKVLGLQPLWVEPLEDAVQPAAKRQQRRGRRFFALRRRSLRRVPVRRRFASHIFRRRIFHARPLAGAAVVAVIGHLRAPIPKTPPRRSVPRPQCAAPGRDGAPSPRSDTARARRRAAVSRFRSAPTQGATEAPAGSLRDRRAARRLPALPPRPAARRPPAGGFP